MARQWMTPEGFVIDEEGADEYIAPEGFVVNEDQAGVKPPTGLLLLGVGS